MTNNSIEILNELFCNYPCLCSLKEKIIISIEMIMDSYNKGCKILLCGNGGSAADSEHIVGELLKSFKKKRNIPKDISEKLILQGGESIKIERCLEGTLPAISLTSHISFATAFSNDNESSLVFAQQLLGLGNSGDTLICLSTSGNSQNCVYASFVAKAKNIKIISFTGMNDSRLSKISDVTINVPEIETYRIQELHMPIYHCICAVVEEEFF